MQFRSLAFLVAVAASVSASPCQKGSSGLAKPADLLKMADNCQISEMSESLSDAAACNAAHIKELKADFQSKASKLHLKGRRSNKAETELKQLDADFGKSVDAMTKLNTEIGQALISLNKKLGSTLKDGEKNVTSTVAKVITDGERSEKKVEGDVKKVGEKISSQVKNGTESLKEEAEKEHKKVAEHKQKVAESFKAEKSKNKANGIKAMEKVCKEVKETDLNDLEREFKHFGKSVRTSLKDFKPFAAYFNSSKASVESFEKSMTSLSSEMKAFGSKVECDLNTIMTDTVKLVQEVLGMASTKVENSPASTLQDLVKAIL